jgi:protein-L-isoaspartate(D-aspartate) O-methyltransferase
MTIKVQNKKSARSAGLCDPDWIRTNDLLLRRQLLYPTELPDPFFTSAKVRKSISLSNFYLCCVMRKYDDSYRHKGLRKQLVDTLKKKGITDERVLNAINNIPRHYFLDSAFDKVAYEDRAFPIAEGQTISQPYTVAYQTQLLEVKQYEKILEIGTGSGYQAMVLAEMGAQVYTIERQRKLFEEHRNFILRKKYSNIKYFFGDGYEGLPTFAPFDKIIVTAAAPSIPDKLVKQLKKHGKMIIPVGEGSVQVMKRITKNEDGTASEEVLEKFSFVPMVEGRNN